MKENVRILGVRIDNLSRDEIKDRIKDILNFSPQQKFVTTLNPEILLKTREDGEYRDILNSGDLNLCDGYGIKLVSFLKGKPVRERFAGADLTELLIREGKKGGHKMLVAVAGNSLSAPPEIEESVGKRFGVGIRAVSAGDPDFFAREEVRNAEIIFVNFGAPRQERFIFENREKFPKGKILIGVGGTFDFLTGKFKRAPRWMRGIGLEWFWRLAQEPKRIGRISRAVFLFPFHALLGNNRKI